MASIRRRSLLLTIATCSLAACASTPSSPSEHLAATVSSTGSTLVDPALPSSVGNAVHDTANGISFERPAEWTRWQPNGHQPANDGPLIYLSTDPLLPGCAVAPGASPNPPDAGGRACDQPLTMLSPNGVLVTWMTTRILEQLPTDGEAISVNGDEARLDVERPGSCVAVGADETITVLVPIGQPTRLSNLVVVACLRGPDLGAAEAQFRGMLTSASVDR
jgi:hypothetical protein